MFAPKLARPLPLPCKIVSSEFPEGEEDGMFTAERDVEEDVDVGVFLDSGGPPLEPEDCESLTVSPGDFGARVECMLQ